MDQQKRYNLSQNVLDFKCKKIISTTSEKSGVSEEKNLESKMACETPVKISETLPKKSLDIREKLPEKYRIVAELFDYMNCSLKLLGLHKKLLAFENVSIQMEVFTKRYFSHQNLAQLKYILPEALQIDKILIHDKKTLCMKPDMKISILFDVVEGHSEVSDFVALSQLFSSRLYTFSTTHPEACDVPEAILPEPFNQRSPVTVPDELHMDFPVKSQPSSAETVISEKASPKPYFGRRFSENSSIDEKQKIEISAPVRPSVPSPVICQDTKATLPENSASTYSEPEPEPIAPKPESHKSNAKHSLGESPLPKLESHGESFAVETPSQLIPRRLVSSCDRTHENTSSHDSTQSCKPAKRTLDFFQSECDGHGLDLYGNKLEYDQLRDLDNSQVTKGVYKDARNPSFSLALSDEAEKPIDIGNLGESTSPNSSSSLVDNVALIHSIFKSDNFAAITKEQLVYKIIVNSLDIVEKKVVEDQLDLIEKRVPDWIWKKLVTSGDIVYNIKDEFDLDSIRAKLTSI